MGEIIAVLIMHLVVLLEVLIVVFLVVSLEAFLEVRQVASLEARSVVRLVARFGLVETFRSILGVFSGIGSTSRKQFLVEHSSRARFMRCVSLP